MKPFFLDQGVIVAYANAIFEEKEIQEIIDKHAENAQKFVEKNKGNLITCQYITKADLPRFLKRRSFLVKELYKKLNNPSYEICSKELWKQDLQWAKKLIWLKDVLGENTINIALFTIEMNFSRRVELMLSTMISKIVIPVEEIDKELAMHLRTYIKNFSDSMVIASAMQYNVQEEIVAVTTDKEWENANLVFVNPGVEKKYKELEIRFLWDVA